MSRNFSVCFLLLSLSLTLAGCHTSNNLVTYENNTHQEENNNHGNEETINYDDLELSDINSLPEDMASMNELIKCVTTSMAGLDMFYGNDTPNQFWYLIAQLLMDEGANHPDAVIDQDDVCLTEDIIKEFACAAFSNYNATDSLPDFPPGFTTVYYRTEEELYSTPNDPLGDDIHFDYMGYAKTDDSTYVIKGNLMYQDELQAVFYVVLVPSTYNGNNHMFPYSIKYIERT